MEPPLLEYNWLPAAVAGNTATDDLPPLITEEAAMMDSSPSWEDALLRAGMMEEDSHHLPSTSMVETTGGGGGNNDNTNNGNNIDDQSHQIQSCSMLNGGGGMPQTEVVAAVATGMSAMLSTPEVEAPCPSFGSSEFLSATTITSSTNSRLAPTYLPDTTNYADACDAMWGPDIMMASTSNATMKAADPWDVSSGNTDVAAAVAVNPTAVETAEMTVDINPPSPSDIFNSQFDDFTGTGLINTQDLEFIMEHMDPILKEGGLAALDSVLSSSFDQQHQQQQQQPDVDDRKPLEPAAPTLANALTTASGSGGQQQQQQTVLATLDVDVIKPEPSAATIPVITAAPPHHPIQIILQTRENVPLQQQQVVVQPLTTSVAADMKQPGFIYVLKKEGGEEVDVVQPSSAATPPFTRITPPVVTAPVTAVVKQPAAARNIATLQTTPTPGPVAAPAGTTAAGRGAGSTRRASVQSFPSVLATIQAATTGGGGATTKRGRGRPPKKDEARKITPRVNSRGQILSEESGSEAALTDGGETLTPEQISFMKWRRQRDWNNLASRRCRERRKEKFAQQVDELKQLMDRNAELRERLTTVEREVSHYKQQLLSTVLQRGGGGGGGAGSRLNPNVMWSNQGLSPKQMLALYGGGGSGEAEAFSFSNLL